jgi:hypothetical protein
MNNYGYNPGEALLMKLVDIFEDEQFLIADGHDYAIIGYDEREGRLIYSVSAIILHLHEYDGMSEEEAQEFFDFNIYNAHVGEKTPIWCFDDY